MWINPKVIIGNTATGEYYFHRPIIVAEIWDQIERGNHVLLTAPRRVGKSSVMKYMAANAQEENKCIFENVQGIKNEDEFYKKVYLLLKSCLGNVKKSATWVIDFFRKIKIEEIDATGSIKFGDRTINYLEAINYILPKLNDEGIKVILFIDELPEVLHSLNKAGKKDEAGSILKNLRNWRQDDQFRNLCLVLAGSIGIHHVVKSIEGRTTDTNDFNKVDFESLTSDEAYNYIGWATEGATIQYDDSLKKYLLAKIGQYIPYFINLMLDEINRLARRKNDSNITPENIDNAFDIIVKNSDHFRDWKNRLFDYMVPEDANFQNDVLTYIAHSGSITQQKLYDFAVRDNKKTGYMELVGGLEKDGYIIEIENKYVFLSPFLQSFWKRENPIYNAE